MRLKLHLLVAAGTAVVFRLHAHRCVRRCHRRRRQVLLAAAGSARPCLRVANGTVHRLTASKLAANSRSTAYGPAMAGVMSGPK